MKLKKILVSLLAVTTIGAGMLSMTSCNENNEEGPAPVVEAYSVGLEFKLSSDSKSYSVASIGTCEDKKIIIPSLYEGLPVKEITKEAFYNCGDIQSVTIGSNVTSIGDAAFKYCDGLTSVVFSGESQLEKIGKEAFYWCRNVKLTIPSPVKSIGDYAFYNCDRLEKISIGNKTPKGKGELALGVAAFYDCDGLTDVTIGKNVSSVGKYAFYDCGSLKNLTVDAVAATKATDWMKIDEYAFYNCDKLESVKMDNGTITLGFSAFYDCDGLKELKLGNEVKSIGAYAFRDCNQLKSVTIGKSVESIGVSAFSDCGQLETINMSDSVTSIESGAFKNTAYYNNKANWVDCVLYMGNHLIEAQKDIESCTIKDGTVCIADYAFLHCEQLDEVVIPESVKTIATYAFACCYNLKEVKLSKAVTSVGNYAFWNCTDLKTMTFDGTSAEWNKVTKGKDWNYQIPATEVACSDDVKA